jgi:hypothetical protein
MLLLVLEGLDGWRRWGCWVHAIVLGLRQCDLIDTNMGNVS